MNNENSEIVVSICCITYNHEPYIRDAIEGFLMQKTDFPFEILIHDDASTDGTADIIREYEAKYPDIIKPIYQTENQYSKGINPYPAFVYPRARGKYIALCEGDDYWIDPYKLQKQVDFLEKNPDYIACAHNVEVVDKNNRLLQNIKYPECKIELYSLNHFRDGILPGQTCSLIMRNIFKENKINTSLFDKIPPNMPGDRVLFFLLAANGKIHCFQGKMGAYRYVITEGESFSARQNQNKIVTPIKLVEYYKEFVIHAHCNFKNTEAIKIIESIYFSIIVSGFLLKRNHFNWVLLKEAWKLLDNKTNSLMYSLKNLCLKFLKKIRKNKILTISH